MSIIHQKQIVVRKSGTTAEPEREGCFVACDTAGTVTLTTASAPPANVFGVLHSVAEAGADVSVILPGFAGIVGVRLHQGATATAGETLVLAANGTVKPATTGTVVAIALENAGAGTLVAARLVEPYTAA